MNIKESLKWGKDQLLLCDVSEPEASARALLSSVLGLTRTQLAAEPERKLTVGEERKYRKYIKKRQGHEPVWQIIGQVDFWGMPYLVTKNVMVPRPETEILVNKALEHVGKRKKEKFRILDLGTGSGTIAVALAKELGEAEVCASDVSAAALAVAKKNAKRLLGSRKITFKRGDLLVPWKGQKFDIITANLPYIPHEDMSSLQFDVLHHEPRVSLDGGKGGLEIYERLLHELPDHLTPRGAVFCEIGIGQGEELGRLVGKYLPEYSLEVLGDLAGIDRIGIIKKLRE